MNPGALSIVMPTFNEAGRIAQRLDALQGLRAQGVEIVVADGGSADETARLARPLCDVLVSAPRGRASQMNAGARIARGGALLFLHADTRLPAVRRAVDSGAVGGRFDVRVRGRHPAFGLLSAAINVRSRWTGIATGDQAPFVTRAAFEALGGFEAVPLMEDVRFTARLRGIGRVEALRERVETSGRRWEEHGFLRTVLLMWRLRLLHAFGASPERLARMYPRR